MRLSARRAAVTVLGALALVASAAPAFAHEERASTFPEGERPPPVTRSLAEGADTLVVCKPDSGDRIANMTDATVKAFNQGLLDRCAFENIQDAVNAVDVRGTNIYVLPGVYREEPSRAPACAEDYDGGEVSYAQLKECPGLLNLVTIAGDEDPATREVECGVRCDLQIEGTGERMDDVVLRGGFTEDGDWVKHNGIKADRADGFVLRNITAELFRENAVYVHETNGYRLDEVNARNNDLYGILTFTSDHGVISNCDTSFNGDSGVYPGSSADVNADNDVTERLSHWSVEIFGCKTYNNALGFSGTAGNSVYFHDNEVFDNQAGYVTDSFVGGHPGMPQDHAWLRNNKIYSNNNNYVAEFVQSGTCSKPPAERGYGSGTVCPAFPVPVGTGVLIAGGNRNLVEENQIYDNWRTGLKLLWVPGAIRGDMGVLSQLDTSNGNQFVNNRLGFHPSGVPQPNGRDVEWDEQGLGNCWQGNVSSNGEVTHDVLLPTGLPDCDSGGSKSSAGNAVKSAQMAPCSEYNREDNPDPAGCDWFESPAQPAGRQEPPGQTSAPPAGAGSGGSGSPPPAEVARAAGDTTSVQTTAVARSLPATGVALLPAAAGLLLLSGTVLHLRRRTRAS